MRVGLLGIPGAVAMMMVGWRQGAEVAMQKARVYVYGRGFGTVTDSAVTEHRPPLMPGLFIVRGIHTGDTPVTTGSNSLHQRIGLSLIIAPVMRVVHELHHHHF